MLGAAEIMELNGPNWLDQFWVKPTHKSYVFGWFWLTHWMGQTGPVPGQILMGSKSDLGLHLML